MMMMMMMISTVLTVVLVNVYSSHFTVRLIKGLNIDM